MARREFLSKTGQGVAGLALGLSATGGSLLWTPVAAGGLWYGEPT